MAGLTRDQRAQRDAEQLRQEREAGAEAKRTDQFGGNAYGLLQQQVDRTNAIDERAPDRRPATIVNHDTQEPAPDNRQFAGDVGKSLNQMVGRVAITENDNPQPYLRPQSAVPDVHGRSQGEGELVRLSRGYQPDEGQGGNQGIKRVAGEELRLPMKEAKRLVNLGAAKFVDED